MNLLKYQVLRLLQVGKPGLSIPRGTNTYNISNDEIGKYFYIYAHDLGDYIKSYYKIEIKNVGAIYAQVKVIDNTTIVIKKGATETTYAVTSYSLKT